MITKLTSNSTIAKQYLNMTNNKDFSFDCKIGTVKVIFSKYTYQFIFNNIHSKQGISNHVSGLYQNSFDEMCNIFYEMILYSYKQNMIRSYIPIGKGENSE